MPTAEKVFNDSFNNSSQNSNGTENINQFYFYEVSYFINFELAREISIQCVMMKKEIFSNLDNRIIQPEWEEFKTKFVFSNYTFYLLIL